MEFVLVRRYQKNVTAILYRFTIQQMIDSIIMFKNLMVCVINIMLNQKGIEIENPTEPLKGKIWVPYINEKKSDWDTLVENNTRISITDHLLWKLEHLKK